MSAVEKITVQLSNFEKLHILRQQLEDRQEEFTALGAEIRDKLTLIETQRYLETMSPYYAANPVVGLPTREEIDALELRRQQLSDLIQNIEATIPVILNQKDSPPVPTSGETPSAPAGPARKVKFDSFDDFRSNRE